MFYDTSARIMERSAPLAYAAKHGGIYVYMQVRREAIYMPRMNPFTAEHRFRRLRNLPYMSTALLPSP